MHPSEFFERPHLVNGGRCFVAMPFREPFSDLVFKQIRMALSAVGMECHRADEHLGGGAVMNDVLRGIAEAELVIVELTGNNPNVLYELGIAHAARPKKSVLLITQNVRDAPFDISHLRMLLYSTDTAGLDKFRSTLAYMVQKEILPSRFTYRWSDNKMGKTSEKHRGDGGRLYSFRVCDVLPARDSADFRLIVWRHQIDHPNEEVHNEVYSAVEPQRTVRVPFLPTWSIKLDTASGDDAEFCACRTPIAA